MPDHAGRLPRVLLRRRIRPEDRGGHAGAGAHSRRGGFRQRRRGHRCGHDLVRGRGVPWRREGRRQGRHHRIGGLGQIGARVAHLLGAEVHVAEIKEDIWPLAKELGAVDARRSITDYPKGFFDVIVDFAGFGDTTADAVDVIRLGGVVVLVGMGRLETTIDAKSLIVNQCDLRGSNGGTPDDIRGVYELMRTGKLTPVTTTVSFDEVPEAIERLERGDVVGRLVISYE